MKPYLLSSSATNSKYVSNNNLYKPVYSVVRQDQVVTSSMALYYDFSNPFSYNGSGDTLKDLSINNSNASNTSAHTYSSTYGGMVTMSGSSSINTGYTTQACSNSSLQSFCFWTVGTNITVSGSSAGANGQHHLRFGYEPTGRVFHGVSNYGGGSESEASATGITINAANFICLVKTAAYYYDIYMNGVRVIQNSYKDANTSTTFQIGRYYGSSYPTPFAWSSCMIYNKALSAAEILQNYDATRYRFNL